jgi:Cu/Zn superoxide dismutase
MTRRVGMRAMLTAVLAAGVGTAVLAPRALRAASLGVVDLVAVASGADETPANTSTATAIGHFSVSADHTKLVYDVKVSGLSSDAVAMHLHMAPRGKAGPIMIGLDTPVDGRAVGCVTGLKSTDVDALLDPNQVLYMNIHTKNFPGGEIRGQVVPVP